MSQTPSINAIRNGIVAWARPHGLLVDTFPIPREEDGDSALCPFPELAIDFFRVSRRIVRITAESPALTIFSSRVIAIGKQKILKDSFAEEYGGYGYRLEFGVSRSFKVDQKLAPSGLSPIYHHNEKISCGSSVGLGNQRNAGTLTLLAKHKDDPTSIYGVSCNHVLGGCSTARPDTPIVVPGIQDVTPEFPSITVIGKHDSTATMAQGLPGIINTSKNFDLSFFVLDQPGLLSSMQGAGSESFDTPTKFCKVAQDIEVKKWGRSTGLTHGYINSINPENEGIDYNIVSHFSPTHSEVFKGTVYFKGLIEIAPEGASPFSTGGDSGALVVTEDGSKIVGIIVAGSQSKSLVLPLKAALASVHLVPLSGHQV